MLSSFENVLLIKHSEQNEMCPGIMMCNIFIIFVLIGFITSNLLRLSPKFIRYNPSPKDNAIDGR